MLCFSCFKQHTAYEMRISDWSSDVCSSDLVATPPDAETIDAKGLVVAPGLIDLGVFATDKPAFHFGGITRAALMPDQSSPLDDAGLIRQATRAGKPDFWVHPIAAATRGLKGAELADIGDRQSAV